MMQVRKVLQMGQTLMVLIPVVLNLRMLLHGMEGLSLVVQNAADIAGYLKEDTVGAGAACSNDKEGMGDNVARTHTADKIAVDIV